MATVRIFPYRRQHSFRTTYEKRQGSPVNNKRRKAFTLIELLVVIAIISIIAAILFPVFAQVREKARASACLSNAKQIALADLQYTQDNDEMLFSNPEASRGTFFSILLMPYIKNEDVWHCPDQTTNPMGFGAYKVYPTTYVVSYGLASPGPHAPRRLLRWKEPDPYPVTVLDTPAEIALLSDAVYYWNWTVCEQDPAKAPGVGSYYFGQQDPSSYTSFVGQPTHHGGNNFVFGDGHARWKPVVALPAGNPEEWAGYDPGARAMDGDCMIFSHS
jgi:prepilin-type N-terminal cleavage/methylation domain-containing protein